MTVKQLVLPANRAFNSNGFPIPGATANLYLSGTTTPANFYSDAGLSTSLGSTLTANGAGRFDIAAYQDDSTAFRLIVKDADGAQLDDVDPFYFGYEGPQGVKGDAGGPLLDLSGAVTVSGTTTFTRAIGAAASGSTVPVHWDTTFTGNADGTTTVYGTQKTVTASGVNDVAAIRNQYLETFVNMSGAGVTTAWGTHTVVFLQGSGPTDNVRVVEAHYRVDGSGGTTAAADVFNVASATYNGTGTTPFLNLFNGQDCGHATLVGDLRVFCAADQTASSVRTQGFYGGLTSGTNKFNLYMAGSATNYLQGSLGIGLDAPTEKVDVLGNTNVSGVYKVDGTTVVNTRVTGWTQATGTATRTGFATGSATVQQVAEALKALIDDMFHHGLINA